MAGIITEERRLTLSQLQAGIKNTLAKAWGGYLWVVAEISDLKLNMSGHCYLELVEKDEDSEATLASMRGVIWKNVAADIFDTFESSTGMELSPGMKILMNCRVTYHELYGMSLSIVAIDPTYTLGERQRQRMLAIEKLKEQGLFDLNRSVTPPVVIQRIAVVSSGNAAGYRDFMQEIAANEYGFHFELTLFSAIMQGNEAEASKPPRAVRRGSDNKGRRFHNRPIMLRQLRDSRGDSVHEPTRTDGHRSRQRYLRYRHGRFRVTQNADSDSGMADRPNGGVRQRAIHLYGVS